MREWGWGLGVPWCTGHTQPDVARPKQDTMHPTRLPTPSRGRTARRGFGPYTCMCSLRGLGPDANRHKATGDDPHPDPHPTKKLHTTPLHTVPKKPAQVTNEGDWGTV